MGVPKRRWTAEEEGALRAGIAKYGPGKWKFIQRDPEFNLFLRSRSNIDLKDKWRNMGAATQGSWEKCRTPKVKAFQEPPVVPPPDVLTSSSDLPAVQELPAEHVKEEASKDLPDVKNGPRYNDMIFEALSTTEGTNGLDITQLIAFIEQRAEVPPNFRKLLGSRLRRLAATEKLKKELKSPAMFLEEARTILSDSSETVKAFNRSSMVVGRRTEAADVVTKEKPRERQPSLGLKRFRSSLEPNSSQPSENLLPDIDIDQYLHPVEFFAAVERREHARKELQKLGALTEFDQNVPSMAERRQRRPGLPGRSVNYRQHYPMKMDVLLSSQKTSGQGTHSQSSNSMSPETNDHDIPSDRRRAESGQGTCSQYCNSMPPDTNDHDILSEIRRTYGDVSAAAENVNDLLDESMPEKYAVDGNGAENMLQELLQIKPFELMHDIPQRESKTSLEALPNRRAGKSVLHEMMVTVPVDTSSGFSLVAVKSIHRHLSSTLPKSPLASISSLQRRITQTLVTNDPFSFANSDSSPVGNSSLKEQASKESDQIDKGVPTVYGELDSQIHDKDSVNRSACGELNVSAMRDLLSSKEILSDNATLDGVCLDTSCADADCMNNNMDDRVNNNFGDHGDDVACAATGPKDLGNEVSEIGQSLPSKPDSLGHVMETLGVEESSPKVDPPLNVQEEHLSLAIEKTPEACDARKGGRGKATSHTDNLKKIVKGKSKAAPDRARRGKDLSRRQSLAGAGTNWDCGVRRSTRIRMRPLEYWKGERMLYARLHESLVTAIGVKYMSPCKDGHAQMKVKSFVSDEYKDLVERVALY